ncbi:MAG: bifunctional hydroxymethylpyrimidine kinase/phosphomethylpyrimidine kinase [Halobacteriota archaeon]
MRAVMTIAGSDSGGGAGIQADIRTFAALGVHGTSAVTAITAQNTLGILEIYPLPSSVIVDQMIAVFSDLDIQCIKTGMLATPKIAEAVADLLSLHKVPVVVDPVMAAEAGGQLVEGDPTEVFRRLLPEATSVTPNIREAEILSGVTIREIDDMKRAAYEIYALGPKSVIVTGGHLSGTDVVYNGDFEVLKGSLIEGGTHGAGCTFSAAVTAFIAKGYDVPRSAKMAKAFVTEGIRGGERIGAGVGAVNQVAATLDKAERYLTVLNIEEALHTIKTINVELVPEVGSNLAMAISRAKTVADVAGVRGRIIKVGQTIIPVGCVAFGASRHVGRVILAAMQAETNVKSAMNVRCSKEIIDACRDLNFVISSFDRAREPDTTSLAEWGTTNAIETSVRAGRGMPEVVYDSGGIGVEPMVRILGQSAREVADKVMQISAILR